MSIFRLYILDDEVRSMFLKQNSQLNSSLHSKQLSIQNEDETSNFHLTKSKSVSQSSHWNEVNKNFKHLKWPIVYTFLLAVK